MISRLSPYAFGIAALTALPIASLALLSAPAASEPEAILQGRHFADVAKDVQRGVEVTVNDMTMYTDVYRVYARPNNSNHWGSDRLGSNILSPGDSLSFSLPTGRYDICVEQHAADGSSDMYHYIWEDVNIGSSGHRFNINHEWNSSNLTPGYCTSGPAPAAQHSVNVRDLTSDTDVYRIYARPSSSGNWGNDRLGSRILHPGETFSFDVTEGRYDVCVEVRHRHAWQPSDTPISYVWNDIAIESGHNFNVQHEAYPGNNVYGYGYCLDR